MCYNFSAAVMLLLGENMNTSLNTTSSQGLVSEILDLSAGLGYGLFYQPVLVSNAEFPFDSILSSIHRRLKRRAKHCEMRI